MPSAPSSRRHRFTVRVVVGIALLAGTAFAQRGKPHPAPHPAPAPPGATEAKPGDQKKEEAKTRFDRGMTLFDKKVWDAALVEFLESRAAYPTRSNTQNAAICLRNLNRFDEALDMFEALVKEFPNLSATDRAAVDKEIVELQALVGAIDIRAREDGAQITIDGRERGLTPSPPLRVSAGTHVIRVYKEGFAPVEKRVEVAGKQTLVIEPKLETLTQSGRLSVAEDGGKSGSEVLVDNVVVGKTPWQGLVAIGDHVVFLRGQGNLGTQPASATVRINQVTPIVLALEPLDCNLRVEPTPAGATVALDGVAVGSGLWDGRLRKGRHKIEVAQSGFLPQTRELDLTPGRAERLAVALERDPDSPLWRAEKPNRIYAEIAPSFPIALVLGGETADGGDASFPLGVTGRAHVGYELRSGVGFGLAAGYLYLARTVEDRPSVLRPVGKPEAPGTADDRLSLKGLLIGASAHLHRNTFGEKVPLLLRVGVGALLANVNDRRSGDFTVPGGASIPVVTARTSVDVPYLYLAPEARVGYRIADRIELTAGVEVMVMVALEEARWEPQNAVILGNQGLAGYDSGTIFGSTLLLVNPGVGARFDF
ncbi:MAG: PEGA domain-containing protein [Labilithrix sp.]|nr:PEGA domain-containing protein [Labilithrix sp.]